MSEARDYMIGIPLLTSDIAGMLVGLQARLDLLEANVHTVLADYPEHQEDTEIGA